MKTVLVDSREPMAMGSELSLKLPSDTQVESAFMQFGDIVWFTDGPSFGIEMKSASDFISSLWRKDRGERLERQLTGLRGTYDNAFLGIYGVLTPAQEGGLIIGKETVLGRDNLISKIQARTKISARQVESFLFSVSHPTSGNPVHVIWRPTKDGVLEAIAAIYNSSQKPGGHNTFNHILAQAKPQINKEEDQWLSTYMSIRGIGEASARKLLREVGTPAECIALLTSLHGSMENPHTKKGKVLTPSMILSLRRGFGIKSQN